MNYLKMNEEKLVPVVFDLNILLADYNIYYQKLRSFHWNVLGENFFELHEKFEALYNDAKTKIDEIAERILTLNYHPLSRFEEYLKVSSIKEVSPLITDKEMVEALLKDHETLLTQMRIVIKQATEAEDEGTMDLMAGYIASLEKASWMLHAWSTNTKAQLDVSVIREYKEK